MTSPVQLGADLAPDPDLPRRDGLLDEAYVAARLEELLAVGETSTVRRCTRVRARYRRGESLRATYRVSTDSDSRLVSARMFTGTKAPTKFAQARQAALSQGAPPGSVLLDDALSTVFWVFPQDRKLRGLAHLVDPPASLRRVFGDPWERSELVAYTPEKAATVRCTRDSGATIGFAKVQTGDAGHHSAAVLRAARRGLPINSPLQLPEVVGHLARHQMALFSAAPGSPLNQLARSRLPEAMAALGAALSVLHRQPTDGFPSFTRFAPDRIAAAGELLRAARPDVAGLTSALVGLLLATRPQPSPAVLLHGDLHPKNILVHDNGISLVDLDQAGAGVGAADLSGTLARLWCPRPGDDLDAATAAAAADALLASYARPPEHAELVWYAAAALLVERAMRAVSRVDVATLADLERVLATAMRWAEDRTEEPL